MPSIHPKCRKTANKTRSIADLIYTRPYLQTTDDNLEKGPSLLAELWPQLYGHESRAYCSSPRRVVINMSRFVKLIDTFRRNLLKVVYLSAVFTLFPRKSAGSATCSDIGFAPSLTSYFLHQEHGGLMAQMMENCDRGNKGCDKDRRDTFFFTWKVNLVYTRIF